jgi:hypothetical protein
MPWRQIHVVGDAGKAHVSRSLDRFRTNRLVTPISRFLKDLARPHVIGQDLSAGYAAMASAEARETAAAA